MIMQKIDSSNRGSQQLLPFSLSKGIISFFALIILILTISGSSALLASPIHPIGLVLGILIPSYLFLIFALLKKHSIATTLLLYVQNQLSKRQSAYKSMRQIDSQALLLLGKAIMHSTWVVIFCGVILGLFFQFTLKQYEFNLYSTLFPYESGAYLHIIKVFNFLPNLFIDESITPELIASSLNGTPSLTDNAQWARWIILMIILYGLSPRIILSIVALSRYRQYLKSHSTTESHQPAVTLIDPAKSRPVSLRAPKTITHGEGSRAIALDFSQPLPLNVEVINDRNDFNKLHEILKAAPLAQLTLYIDSSLTPDRSLLRRIYTLLNLAMESEIILVQTALHSRDSEWQSKIHPNLYPKEEISIQALDAFTKKR